MVSDGEIWREDELERYLRIFPEGQFCAEYSGRIIGSASSLVISEDLDLVNHTWDGICYNDIEKTFDPRGNVLYDVDISTDPEYRRLGVGTQLYMVRKELVISQNLRRILSAARLPNYSHHTELEPSEYVRQVITGKICDAVLNFQLKNQFQFIKVLSGYMKDSESCNYAALTEWVNPCYAEMASTKMCLVKASR